MTTISRSERSAQPARVPSGVLDVRCSAAVPRPEPDEGRCQLFAGHSGPHALMLGRDGERIVRTWTGRDCRSVRDAGPEGLQRPWMFGYPLPAWFEKPAPGASS